MTASCMVRCYSVRQLMILDVYCTCLLMWVTQLVENSKVHMDGIEDPCQRASGAYCPLGLNFFFRLLGNLSFLIEILFWAPWISLFQSTSLASIVLRTQPCVWPCTAFKIIEVGSYCVCIYSVLSYYLADQYSTDWANQMICGVEQWHHLTHWASLIISHTFFQSVNMLFHLLRVANTSYTDKTKGICLEA